MSFGIAARIARRELRGGLRGFRIFLACLALGVAAIAAVGSVREGIRDGLAREGATILGGDAEIELTYRTASVEERAWMDSVAEAVSEVVEFRSMAVFGKGDTVRRGLTQVKAVDGVYPLYGTPRLAPDMPLEQALQSQGGLPGAVMDPVLVERLGMTVGDRFTLGEQDFVLTAALVREPDNATGSFGLGPRSIVRTEDLANSGLLQPGTLFETDYRLKLAPGTDLDTLRAQAKDAIQGGGFRWRDSRNGAPGAAVFVERLGNFLILVGLAGLAVGGVGISAAVRSYVEEKVPVIATLKSLGAEGRTIFQIYLVQIGLLALLGIGIGVAIGTAAPLLLAPVIEARLPLPMASGIQPVPLAEAALYGFLAAALFAIWPISRTGNVRAAALFRDAALGLHGWPQPRFIVLTGVLLGSLVVSAALLSGQARLTYWAAAGILGAFMALALAAFALRWLARRLALSAPLRRWPVLRRSLGSVGGPGGEAVSVVLSLGLGLSVLAAVGQIDANLRSAIARDLPAVAPSYFVVDIQPGQMAGFVERLEADASVSRYETAPMLRGVITRINDRPAVEIAGNHWVISGDRGITYSPEPPPGTEITAGTWWGRDYSGEPQISFAAEEAAEIGLKLGDNLTVNVLGRDITGTVTSFRKVDFSNAGMGFVLSMNPAAIQAAPHTFIATIYVEEAAEAALIRDLTDAYPNITAIRVRDAIERVAEVLRGIAAAITYAALAALLTGVIVLIGAAAAGERLRTYEAAVLKTLGATRPVILADFALRSAILGMAAGMVAVFAGGAASWAVMTQVMDSSYRFEPVSAGAIITGGVAATVLAGLYFSFRSLRQRPARILRSRE